MLSGRLKKQVTILNRANIDGLPTGIGNGELKNISYGSTGNLVQLVQNVGYTKKSLPPQLEGKPGCKNLIADDNIIEIEPFSGSSRNNDPEPYR
jgi:hypothetical protein